MAAVPATFSQTAPVDTKPQVQTTTRPPDATASQSGGSSHASPEGAKEAAHTGVAVVFELGHRFVLERRKSARQDALTEDAPGAGNRRRQKMTATTCATQDTTISVAVTTTGARAALVWRLRAKSVRYQPAGRRLKSRSFGRLV